MNDEELDRNWKPSGRRPQSTIAQSFSQELMDIFRIDNSVADLDEQVDKRKHTLNSQTNELQSLEARIREMEARLKSRRTTVSGGSDPSAAGPSATSPRNARPPIGDAFAADAKPLELRQQQRPSSRSQDAQKHGGSRPGTARASQQAVPGALPPTPVGSEDGDGEH